MKDTGIPVYAYLGEDQGQYALTTTYKPYFDKEGCLDDGSSNDMFPNDPFDTITRRLASTNTVESRCESEWYVLDRYGRDIASIEYESKDGVMPRLISAAASVGIDLIFNDKAFDTFLESHNP